MRINCANTVLFMFPSYIHSARTWSGSFQFCKCIAYMCSKFYNSGALYQGLSV